MNLQELRYLVAMAEHRHFGRAAEACNVSQPTLSSQIKKLEDELGVTLLERTNKRVDITPVGRPDPGTRAEGAGRGRTDGGGGACGARSAGGAAEAGSDSDAGSLFVAADSEAAEARVSGADDRVVGGPDAGPGGWAAQSQAWMRRCWQRRRMRRRLRKSMLFEEPLLAALPRNHRLAGAKKVDEDALADELLVLADGHCLANQALAACGAKQGHPHIRGRPAGVDAGGDAGDAGEPGGGGIWDNADSSAGGWIAGAARDRAAAAGWESPGGRSGWRAGRGFRGPRRCGRSRK